MQIVIEDDHPAMAWIPHHASFLLSRFQVSKDGKTAHEKLKGKSYRGELVDFAERATFMLVALGGKMDKLEVPWEPGRFVRIRPKSGEKRILTKEGVVNARKMRRLPVCDRWVSEDWEERKGVPTPGSRLDRACQVFPQSLSLMLRRLRRK